MSKDFAPRVLLVDDEPLLLKTLSSVLEANGFVCRSARDGFEALRRLRETPPDIIISDLRMPNMSGFELLAIIRRRFPQIAVIVTSGEYLVDVPTSGLLMNAFFQKGEYTPAQLMATMRELYSQCPIRPALPKQEHAPLWINRRSDEFLLATCTDCLRSFPIESEHSPVEGVQTAECPSCGTTITYVVDSNVLKMLESYRESQSKAAVREHEEGDSPQPLEAGNTASYGRVGKSSHKPREKSGEVTTRKAKLEKPRQPKVLVVDDDDQMRTSLGKVLEFNNFQITTATDVKEALHLIHTKSFDVLLSDIRMTQAEDGFTVVNAMHDSNPEAVTLVYTGYSENGQMLDAMLLPASDTQLKPANEIPVKAMAIPSLVSLIHEKLDKRGTPKASNIERVAAILERDSSATISDWLLRVEREEELTRVPLSKEERTGHLPKLIQELVARLRVPRKLGTKAVSEAAVQHGRVRHAQGYSVPMIVEESRILQVSIFETLQNSLKTVNFSLLLIDVMAIADECDSQLKQTIISFNGRAAAA